MAPQRDIRVSKEDSQLCTKCKEVTTTKCTDRSFLKSVSVWINKPHVVNRRLCGSKIVHVFRVRTKEEACEAVDVYNSYYSKKEDAVNSVQFTDLVDESTDFTVVIREFIPKSEFFPKLLEAVIYDKQKVKVSFIPIAQDCTGNTKNLRPTEELQYQIELKKDDSLQEKAQDNKIELSWSCDHDETEQPRRQITSQWLRGTLLEKLVSWSQINDISTSVTSLQLVDVDKYKEKYIHLKNTYGRDLVKNWTERTDPKKFVYEDVAIAAYLLLIWEEERKQKNLSHNQSFVDLGCGNGLLVYILTKEGHKGLGIDLRRRNIWDTFGPDIDLKEKAVSPSSDHLFPEYDWIIGNHSDELTPWIPVIAARSSYNTCFFLLPCCPHDFTGKFALIEKGKSRYESYMDYVKTIINHCGFKAETDSLRIPSTKKICFIGRSRSYEQKNESFVDAMRQAFIERGTIHANHNMKKSQRQGTKLNMILIKSDTDTLSDKSHCPSSHMPSNNSGSTEDLKQTSKTSIHASIIQQTSLVTSRKDNFTESSGAICLSTVGTTSASQDVFDSTTCDKRKFENLGSADSGFDELESDDNLEHSCAKRSKSSISSEGFDEFEHSDQDNSQKDTINSLSLNLIAESSHKMESKVRNICNTEVITTQQWLKDFQPRVEPGMRNCQTVPDEVKSKIVQAAFSLVLSAPETKCVLLSNGKSWTKGGNVSLSEVAALFDKSTMQELKSEHGGLQTLLRNHSHIFQVTGGYVQLRDFTAPDPWVGCSAKKGKTKRNQQDTRKTTLCWFDANHPDGCPREKEDCQFAHGIEELRVKLRRNKIV